MQVLAIYNRGTKLFSGPNPGNETERHVLPGIRHDIILYYDPTRSRHTEAQLVSSLAVLPSGCVRLKTKHTMQIPVTISGIPSYGILDTGAEHTDTNPDGIFLSNNYAQRHSLKITPRHKTPALQASVARR
jgi:hypothetical protein